MRIFACAVLALALGGVAEAQTAPAKPAAPTAPPAAKYTTKLPEVPAGQWGDGILKDARTQDFDGKAYAAVEFERLQEHVDAICHFDKKADIIGKPVATIATYRQNMGWPALVDGRQVDVFRTPHEDGKMILPYILVDVTGILTDLREDIYFKACDGLNFKVCTAALYGHFEWREAKEIPDLGADLAVWDRKCIFVPEHYRKMGIADYGGAIGQASFDAFYKSATTPAKTGH